MTLQDNYYLHDLLDLLHGSKAPYQIFIKSNDVSRPLLRTQSFQKDLRDFYYQHHFSKTTMQDYYYNQPAYY